MEIGGVNHEEASCLPPIRFPPIAKLRRDEETLQSVISHQSHVCSQCSVTGSTGCRYWNCHAFTVMEIGLWETITFHVIITIWIMFIFVRVFSGSRILRVASLVSKTSKKTGTLRSAVCSLLWQVLKAMACGYFVMICWLCWLAAAPLHSAYYGCVVYAQVMDWGGSTYCLSVQISEMKCDVCGGCGGWQRQLELIVWGVFVTLATWQGRAAGLGSSGSAILLPTSTPLIGTD